MQSLLAGRHDEVVDVVFLLPGFMGYDHLSDYQYFADRVAATLRTALWYALGGRDVTVMPLATLPTSRLAARQQFLRDRLTALLKPPEGEKAPRPRIHLVGHSTGGVDAWLLASRRPLAESGGRGGARLENDGGWPGRFDDLVRRHIASVVTISAPFWGAGIAGSAVMQLLAGQTDSPDAVVQGLGQAAQAFAAVGLDRLNRPSALDDLFVNGLVDLRAVLGLGADVCRDRGLIVDLLPPNMARLIRESELELRRPVHCFASTSPPPSGPTLRSGADASQGGERLYRLLHRLIAEAGGDGFAPAVDDNLALLRDPATPVIGRRNVEPAALTRTSHDGIVNTASMVAPRGGSHPVRATLVVGDHGDVVGHYDRRRDPLPGGAGEWALDGFLASGADFDDDAFHALYRAVAAAIAANLAVEQA